MAQGAFLRFVFGLTLLIPATGAPPPSPATEPVCRNGFFLARDRELVRFDERAERRSRVSDLAVTLNALAYMQKEELFYAIADKRFVTVTSGGTITDRGAAPAGLHGAYAAAADGSRWIVQAGNEIVTLATPELTVLSTVRLSEEHGLGDWDFHPPDKMIYGIVAGRQPALVRIDPATGKAEVIAHPVGLPPGSSFGAAAIDIYGVLHVLHNGSGRIFNIPLSAPERTTSSIADLSAFHADAAACPAGYDYSGDPQSTARHTITTFGTLTIGEAVGKDDGVAGPVTVAAEAKTFALTISVRNTTGQPGLLAGWHDLDHDGQFTPGEKAQVTVRPGDTSVALDWPSLTVGTSTDDSRLRLRLFGVVPALPLPEGFASGGEVEDHPLTISWPMPAPIVVPRPPPVVLQPTPTPTPTPLAARPPARATPIDRPHRMPLTLSLFAGMLVPAITVAARAGRKGAR